MCIRVYVCASGEGFRETEPNAQTRLSHGFSPMRYTYNVSTKTSHVLTHLKIETLPCMIDQCQRLKDYVSYKRKYVHEVLVNCLFKLAQENSVFG